MMENPELIFQQINAKSRLLDKLQARVAPKNDPKALQPVCVQQGPVRSPKDIHQQHHLNRAKLRIRN